MFDPVAIAVGFLIGASTSYIIATSSMAISQFGTSLRIKRMKKRAARQTGENWTAFRVDQNALFDDIPYVPSGSDKYIYESPQEFRDRAFKGRIKYPVKN